MDLEFAAPRGHPNADERSAERSFPKDRSVLQHLRSSAPSVFICVLLFNYLELHQHINHFPPRAVPSQHKRSPYNPEDRMLTRLAREFAADVRHAVRQMRRRFAFTATVILTLGLGIGATVALLSVVNALLLQRLPYTDEDRVRVFWMDYDWRGEEYDFA